MAQKLLTALELKVMNQLWAKEKAFVKELIRDWDGEPKPAYNTISTIVRILEEKEFVGHEAHGRSHQYFPVVSRNDYQKRHLRNVIENVFAGSVTTMISSLVDSKDDLSSEDVDGLRKMIDNFEE